MATPDPPRPRLRLREATPADARALTDIQLAAFGIDIINQLLYPDEITQDARHKAADLLFVPHDGQSLEPLLVVAELETTPKKDEYEIVALAKWGLGGGRYLWHSRMLRVLRCRV